MTVVFQNVLEAGNRDGRFLTDVAEEGIACGGLGDGSVLVKAVSTCKAYDVWIERTAGNLLDQSDDALGVLDCELVADEMLSKNDDDVGGCMQVAEGCILWTVQVAVVNGADVEQVSNSLSELVQTGERTIGGGGLAGLRIGQCSTWGGATQVWAGGEHGGAGMRGGEMGMVSTAGGEQERGEGGGRLHCRSESGRLVGGGGRGAGGEGGEMGNDVGRGWMT